MGWRTDRLEYERLQDRWVLLRARFVRYGYLFPFERGGDLVYLWFVISTICS